MKFVKNKVFFVPVFLIYVVVVYFALIDPLATYEDNGLLHGSKSEISNEEEVKEETLENIQEKKALESFVGMAEINSEDILNDETPPLIISRSPVTVTKGATEIPGPHLCLDNIDKVVKCTIEGNYNLDQVGTYNLKRVATDSSGNTSTVPFVLNVVAPKTEKETTTKSQDPETTEKDKHQIADVITKYKTEGTSIGIDVSRWQGIINWEKVKESGVEFVMIRLGYQDGFSGNNKLDQNFLLNFEGAKNAGLKVGVYFYSYSTSTLESVKQAFFVLNTLKTNGFELDLPVAFDWESWNKLSTLKLSLNEFNDCAKIFLDVIKESGYEGILYSSKYYLENGVWQFQNLESNKYQTWLAHYTSSLSETSYEGYSIWQCSCTGKVPGIDSDVDIDIMKNLG